MQELSLKERQKLSLEILVFFDRVCEKNNIPYYLAYGTLLGCVRHSGFIPWDDDIDVWVPFEHYQRLMQLLSCIDSYQLLDFTKGVDWKGYFSKLSSKNTLIVDSTSNNSIKRGVSIDIFPLYNCDMTGHYTKLLNNRIRLLKILSNYYNNQYTSKIKKMFCFFMTKFFWNYKRIVKQILALNEKNIGDYYSTIGSLYGEKDIHSKHLFSVIVKKEFENHVFPIPIGYDSILKELYGNYSELPPVEKRKAHYNTRAYWLKDE